LAFGTSSPVAATSDSNDCGACLKAAGAAHKSTSTQRAALEGSSGRCSAGRHHGSVCPPACRPGAGPCSLAAARDGTRAPKTGCRSVWGASVAAAEGKSGCMSPPGVRTEWYVQEDGELSCLAPRGPDVDAPRGSGTQRHPGTPALLRSLGVRAATNGCCGGEIETPPRCPGCERSSSDPRVQRREPAGPGTTQAERVDDFRRRAGRPSTTARRSAPTRWSG
jgi:hypothetical protein